MNGPNRVRLVDPKTVGGGLTFRDLVPLPAWLILTGRAAWWLILHPAHVAVPAAGIAAAVAFRSVWAGGAAALVTALLVILAVIADAARRSSASGLPAILTGMSRQRRIQRRWPLVAYQVGLTGKGDAGAVPTLRQWRIHDTGVETVMVTGDIARHARDVSKVGENLAAGMFADRCIIRVLSSSAAVVRWDWGAHLGSTYRLPDVPKPTGPNLISWGILEDGGPAETVANLSVLVGGASGSGKSSFAWAWLAGYIASGIPIRVRVLDPGRVEFDALRKQLEKHGKHGEGLAYEYITTTDPKQLDRLWRDLDYALEARLDDVSKRGIREHVPTLDEPLDILLIDELLPYAKDLRADGTGHVIGKIAFLGRKAGYLVCALTQVGQVDTLGRARDVFPQRICFRTLNPDATGAILGGYPESEGAVCSHININDRGVCYLTPPGQSGYSAARAAYVPDNETRTIAAGRLPVPTEAARAVLESSPHVLYRGWGHAGELVYVGISNDFDRRVAEHVRDEDWWRSEVARVTVDDWDHYPNRMLALTAEAVAIRDEQPLRNRALNQGNPNRRPWRTARRLARRVLPGHAHDQEDAA